MQRPFCVSKFRTFQVTAHVFVLKHKPDPLKGEHQPTGSVYGLQQSREQHRNTSMLMTNIKTLSDTVARETQAHRYKHT